MKHANKQSIFSFVAAMALFTVVSNDVTAGAEPFIGEINYVAFDFAPRGWAKCDGQLLPINQNQALFSLLGNRYGGDGRTTFGLPDMRGRVPVHQGQSPGDSSFPIGSHSGSERVILTEAQMPTHTHTAIATSTSNSVVAAGASATSTLKAVNADANNSAAQGNSLANGARGGNVYSASAPTVSMHADSVETTLSGVNITTTTDTAVVVGNAGSSAAFSIMQPYVTVNCIIALEGIFPVRQ